MGTYKHMVDGVEKDVYMDDGLHKQLVDKVKPSVEKKDRDWFCIVDGEEGSGKSVFAMQLAKVLDPEFTHEQIAFNAPEFIRLVMKAKKFQCILLDEAYSGLSSRAALSEMNNLMVALMMEMRQKNLFIIIVMPTFFMLDKYVALHRAKGLFHIFMRDGNRGYWHFFDKQKTKYLYLAGKKFYEYDSQKPRIFGRFFDQYVVNEQKYREVKHNALHKKSRGTKAEVYKDQRDTLIWLVRQEFHISQQKIADLCKKWGFHIGRKHISDILIERKTNMTIKKALVCEDLANEEETKPEELKEPFNSLITSNAPQEVGLEEQSQ